MFGFCMEVEMLREENMQLKRALAVCMNWPLIRRLDAAMQRIDSDEFVGEEEFFRDSPIVV